MLVGSGVTFTAGLLLLGAMPTVYSARALVGPSVGTYDGPIDRLTEQTLSPGALAEVASACDLSPHRSLGEALADLPADPLQRLAARIEVLGAPVQGVVVEASGTSRMAAELAADLLAARLVASDAEHRGRALGAPITSATDATDVAIPVAVPARLLLEQLRLRHPLLRDAEAERRVQAIAARLSEDRIVTAGLRGQLEGLGAEAERLEALVQEEAARAWRLDRAERLAQAERRAPPATPFGAQGGSQGALAPSSRLAVLEAELQLLLTTRTSLHPDVRRLMRMLDSERLRAMAEPPARDTRHAGRSVTDEQASAPLDLDRGALTVADGPPELPQQQPQPPQEGPESYTQRAPSYPAWIEARARVEETRLALDGREQERAAREREHDLLARRLSELAGPRLEEARLGALVEAEARGRGDVAASVAARPTTRAPGEAPLEVIQGAGVHATRSPWRHLPLWALASLLLPLFGGLLLEVRDRSVHRVEDLEGLGAPLLGVVPHLRWGR